MEITHDILKAIKNNSLEIKDLLGELNERERSLTLESLLSSLHEVYDTEAIKKVLAELNEREFIEYAGKHARKLNFEIFKKVIPSEFDKEKILLSLFSDLTVNGTKNRISERVEVALESYKEGFEIGKDLLKENPVHTLSELKELKHKNDIPEKMILDIFEGEVKESGLNNYSNLIRDVVGGNPSKEVINRLFELGMFYEYDYEKIKDKIDIDECLAKYGNEKIFIEGLIKRATNEDKAYLENNFPDLESYSQGMVLATFPEMLDSVRSELRGENRKRFLSYSELSEYEQREVRKIYSDEHNGGHLTYTSFERFIENEVRYGLVRDFRIDYDTPLESGETLREEIKNYFLKNYTNTYRTKRALSFISSKDLAFAKEIIKDITELENFEPVDIPLSGAELSKMGYSFIEEENEGHILNKFDMSYNNKKDIINTLSEEQLKEYVEKKGIRDYSYLLEEYFAKVETADLSILASIDKNSQVGEVLINSDCFVRRVKAFGDYKEIFDNLDSLNEDFRRLFLEIPVKEEYGVTKIDFVRKFISAKGMKYMKDNFPTILAKKHVLDSNDFIADINRRLVKEVLNNIDKEDGIDLKLKNELSTRGISIIGVNNFIDYCSMERDFVIPSNIRKAIYEIYDKTGLGSSNNAEKETDSNKKDAGEGIKDLLLKETSAKTVEDLRYTYTRIKEMNYYSLEELAYNSRLQEVRDMASSVLLRDLEIRESERNNQEKSERLKTENKDYYVKYIKEEVMSISQIEDISDRLISSMEDLLEKDIDLKEVDTIELFNRVKEKISKISSKYQLR